jgi:hypothetical protein
MGRDLFIYSPLPLGTLLGPATDPSTLDRAKLARMPEGVMLRSIVNSGLGASGFAETLEIAAEAKLGGRDVFGFNVDSALNRVFGLRRGRDQTYADMLGRIFIDPAIPNGTSRWYSWNEQSVSAIIAASTRAAVSGSDHHPPRPPPRRLSMGGSTIVYMHPAYTYPRLIPLEMTPLYSGVRQQFGARLGGGYVAPLAYDAEAADRAVPGMAHFVTRGDARRFTLADVIATSGAAPLLGLFRCKPFSMIQLGTQFFPTFNHVAFRDNQGLPAVLGLSHGDGGFTDNLGIMPLLARQVRNIIVFLNSKSGFEDSLELQALFRAQNIREDWGGPIRQRSVRRRQVAGGADSCTAVAAKRMPPSSPPAQWNVKNNGSNITATRGVNVCFVYNPPLRGRGRSCARRHLAPEVGSASFPCPRPSAGARQADQARAPQPACSRTATWTLITSEAAAPARATGDALGQSADIDEPRATALSSIFRITMAPPSVRQSRDAIAACSGGAANPVRDGDLLRPLSVDSTYLSPFRCQLRAPAKVDLAAVSPPQVLSPHPVHASGTPAAGTPMVWTPPAQPIIAAAIVRTTIFVFMAPLLRLQHAAAIPLRHLTDRNGRNDGQGLVVHHDRRILSRHGHVQILAVRRNRQPLGMRPDVHGLDQLEVGQRVRRDIVVPLARGPEDLLVGRDRHAVRRRSLDAVGFLLPAGNIRKLESLHFLLRREINDGDAVIVRELDEDLLGRAVGVGREDLGRMPLGSFRNHATVSVSVDDAITLGRPGPTPRLCHRASHRHCAPPLNRHALDVGHRRRV